MSSQKKSKNDPERLELQLHNDPNNLTCLIQLSNYYIQEIKVNKAGPLVLRAIQVFKGTQLSSSQGLQVIETALAFWKLQRYLSKGTMRINLSNERKDYLEGAHEVASILIKMHDPTISQVVSLKMAYLKECLGSFQDSLVLLSDLITLQAMDNVDLSYIIFKAAILLKHVGQVKQSIEYLEYLLEDPPVSSGYTKTHIYSFLILTYEQSGDKYKVFLSKSYKGLVESILNDAKTAGSSKQQKRLKDIANSKNVNQSSDLWEIFAIQALDRCEYALAAEFLQQASIKAPSKGQLLHWLVEVLFILKENDSASKLGEKALVLLPQSGELRNLLLQISPEKMIEKLRFVSPTKDRETNMESPTKSGRMTNPIQHQDQEKESEEPPQPSSWVTKFMSGVNNTLKGHKDDNKKGKERERSKTPNKDENKSPIQKKKSFQKEKSDLTGSNENSPAPISQTPDQPRAISPFSPLNTSPIHKKQSFRSTKPKKPEISPEAQHILDLVLAGNNNIHLYDPNLSVLKDIKQTSLNKATK